jgi:kynurenine formamidase
MIIGLTLARQNYFADITKGYSIAITLLPNGAQPNHFGAPECTSETVIDGDFIGDTKRGGSCNVNQLTIIPHCNGTHTESVSHIVNQLIPVYQAIDEELFVCALISVNPISGRECVDQYLPAIDSENRVIDRAMLEHRLDSYSDEQLTGLIIRTLPNHNSKKSTTYNSHHYPPFLTNDAMNYLVKRNVKHIMVDFPSVDKMYDDGQLSNHRYFWNVVHDDKDLNPNSITNKTITEMIYVDDEIDDGLYLCNLQIPKIETDAVPSNPIIYQLNKD